VYDSNAYAQVGKTCLNLACERGIIELVKYLDERSAGALIKPAEVSAICRRLQTKKLFGREICKCLGRKAWRMCVRVAYVCK